MPESFHVRLAKEHFVFSAAHFITFGDNICERLHGHNYAVAVEVEGALGEHQYVVDFIALRDAIVQVTGELDHRVLLPTAHPSIRVALTDEEVTATFEDRRWVFPRGDCALLPVENSTAELVARHIGGRVLEALSPLAATTPGRVRVAVDECNGQEGVWEWRAK